MEKTKKQYPKLREYILGENNDSEVPEEIKEDTQKIKRGKTSSSRVRR